MIVMTTALQKQIKKLATLPPMQQDALARLIQFAIDEQEDVAAAAQGFADLAAGRVFTHQQIWAEWDERHKQLFA